MSFRLQQLAEYGFAHAKACDTHQPSYPAESVDTMLDKMNISDMPGARILEISAGTGKLTEQLVACEKSYEIIAVEPFVHMRNVLEGKALPRVTVLDTTPRNMEGVEDAWADGIVITEAGYWMTIFEARDEINRVIKPHGTLALMSNDEDYASGTEKKTTTQWEDKLRQILWEDHDQRWLSIYREQWRRSYYHSPAHKHIVQWTVWLTEEAIWERFRTLSKIGCQTGEPYEGTKTAVFKALDGPDVERNAEGKVALHGLTELTWKTAVPAGSNGSLEGA